ncbi:hypothetical protein [Gulosibacter sp. ACHW.36C]|uniref:Uncharacterized protein n=1 Tax=Gulosibacter sediminis TaxID=1729695 RepID=A0ABY4N2S9_9MICO|nr:hypothetical protein [Gulosibacter sediminis]UQN15757.1 hypothetical protein M3M28_04700 [Gulosibacter sediminis]
MNQVVTTLFLAATATPTPTDQPFDPVDVTPGPVGFFATAALFIAVGLIAMSLMRRSARANARYDIREQLEREELERKAREREGGEAAAAGSASEAEGTDPTQEARGDEDRRS